MFKFIKKARNTQELDTIISKIEINASNNYKDVAQEALKELETRLSEMMAEDGLGERQKKEYQSKLASYKESMKEYTHKDQKPYWTWDK